jgi:pilus assembly protein CpaF
MSESKSNAVAYEERARILEHVRVRVRTGLQSLDASAIDFDVAARTIGSKIVKDELRGMAHGSRESSYESLLAFVNNDLFGLGPIEPLLADAGITDILVADTQIFVVSGPNRYLTKESFESINDVRRIIDRITSRVGKHVDVMSPYCDCDLYDGSRCHIITPPASDKHYITIRKLGCMNLDLSTWVENGVVGVVGADLIKAAVTQKKNIILAGGTGAGKTTLLNTLAKIISSDQIIVTLEDTFELKIDNPNVRRLLTREKGRESGRAITFSHLIKNAMRMNPDRLIMGEVRDEAAFDLLHALNTGHKGSLSTIHGNNVLDSLWRLETLASMAATNCNALSIRRQVARVIDIVVQLRGVELERGRYQNRSVLEICEVASSLNNDCEYELKSVYKAEDA